MSLPEPPPLIRTGRRCQFTMPLWRGRRLCRRVAVCALGDRVYCIPHYDTAWKVTNPEQGPGHEWHLRRSGSTEPWPETCRRCGAIRVHDGLPQCLCRGHQPVITLRASQTASGRLESWPSRPALQNIPIKSALGREIRKKLTGK